MNHPCFNRNAHGRYGRMHLPVAPACNIQCGYCDRKFSCANESRPGVTARVISPQEACELAIRATATMPIAVAGIAGPGDPLANPKATLKTLELVHSALPALHLCLSTNGLALPEHVRSLAEIGVRFLTVTVNAVDPGIGADIYEAVHSEKGTFTGRQGAALLLERQTEGIRQAGEQGMTIKINMVIVPGVNDRHAPAVAEKMAALGVELMNCIPMAPVAGTRLAERGEPEQAELAAARREAEKWLPQMRHCARCRADALGLLGENRVLEELRRSL